MVLCSMPTVVRDLKTQTNDISQYNDMVSNIEMKLTRTTSRLRLKCDGIRSEARFRLSAKRTSPFKSAGGVSSVDYWQPRCTHQR